MMSDYDCPLRTFFQGERCDACGRKSHNPNKQIHLFGPAYNADRAWNTSRWDKEMPASSFFDNECDLDERDREHRRKNSSETGASSGSRRARIIVQLSDSEDEENEAAENEDEEGESNDDEDEEEDEEGGDPSLSRRILPWWQRRWPRAMLREKESRWRLADHCRSRTQLYHTLLHYKFRLFLKVFVWVGQS